MSSLVDRIPPQNLEAEQSVLGAMLIDREAILRVSNLVQADDFYADKHQAIYMAITALFNRGEPADLITVSEELTKAGQMESVGGLSYLASLASAVPTTANVESYGMIVERKSTLRKLQAAARKIVDDCYHADDMDYVLAEAEKSIFAVTQRRTARGYSALRTALVSAYDHIEYLYGNRGQTTGVTSGFKVLDAMTSGFQPSDLIILAARPSVGKTAFSLNLTRNAAVLGKKKVVFFSLEMSAEQLAMRLLSSESAVDAHRLRTGELTDEDWRRLSTGLARLSETEIWIDDTPNIPLMELRSRARRIQAEHGLDMIIIDYLQLMSVGRPGGREQNRQQEISEISRSLKSLARELKVPIIALSQLSRGVEQRTDKRPMMSDLRESGAIEQDADVVAFLYRDDYYDRESEKKNIVEVILAKQRNGPVGAVDVYFMKEIGKFMDVEARRGA